jgi:hypothetical protein
VGCRERDAGDDVDGDVGESSISLEVVPMSRSYRRSTVGIDALSTTLVAMSRRLL